MRAFSYGVKLATVLGAQLSILHVIKTSTDLSHKAPDSRYLRSLRTSALLELGRLARAAGESGASAQPMLLYGDPITNIVETAARRRAEMVVMGSEGRTGWDRLRIGSIADGVIRKARCPVMTVHGSLAGDTPRHPAKATFRRVLAATDFSRDADSTLRVVRRLASKLHAAVRVMHASPSLPASKHVERMLMEQVQILRRDGIEAESICVRGEPVEAILMQAAAYHADLLAVGTRGHSGLNRLMLGSVAKELTSRAGCPVLTVRSVRSHR
jgi:nucleotide-binding universal stress UspA family protein